MLGPITLSLVGHRQFPIMPEVLHVLVLGKVKGQGRNRKEAIMKVVLFKLESQGLFCKWFWKGREWFEITFSVVPPIWSGRRMLSGILYLLTFPPFDYSVLNV